MLSIRQGDKGKPCRIAALVPVRARQPRHAEADIRAADAPCAHSHLGGCLGADDTVFLNGFRRNAEDLLLDSVGIGYDPAFEHFRGAGDFCDPLGNQSRRAGPTPP